MISVVIPTLNEQTRIERALASAAGPGVERIVVDGGSSDATLAAARSAGAERVLECAPGRASQLAAGARAAVGEVVLFLHADTWLGAGWRAAVDAALDDGRVAGGAFRLRFDAAGFRYRLLEAGVALRSRLARLPYGDQALFVRRRALEAAGGIAPAPIFEDLDLVRLIRRSGRLALLDVPAWTSARRYPRRGWIRQVGRNQLALAAYLLGVERERVARWYRRAAA